MLGYQVIIKKYYGIGITVYGYFSHELVIIPLRVVFSRIVKMHLSRRFRRCYTFSINSFLAFPEWFGHHSFSIAIFIFHFTLTILVWILIVLRIVNARLRYFTFH